MSHPKKYIVFSIAAVVISLLIASEAVESWAFGKSLVARYVCKDLKGNKRWEGKLVITLLKEKNMRLMAGEGSGVYYGFDEPVHWKSETEYSDDGNKIILVRMKKVFMSENGDVVFEESQEFDHDKGEVVYLKKWPKEGREVRKVFHYEGDCINEMVLGLYTERFLQAGEREKAFYIVTNDPDIYNVKAWVQKEEDIVVDGVKTHAYKIRLKPKGLIGIFAPITHVWHLARPDFDWLKYRGAEDTLESPVVEMETLDKPELGQ